MENESKKIGFFSRIKIAVTKLENYSIFLEEKMSVCIKYFFLIVLLLAIVMGIVETYSIMKVVSKGYSYIQNELPEFSYENGALTFSENIQAYDEEYDINLITDTSDEVSDELVESYKDTIKNTGLIFLKDKLIYKVSGEETEYKYSELSDAYSIEKFNSQDLENQLDQVGLSGITATIFIILTIGIYIIQLIYIFLDWVVIAVFAYITSRICRINLSLKQSWSISIYALTLSIILMMIYSIAYYVAGFYTEFFRIVYLLIAYIYVVAAILMMKSDLIKQTVEVNKIVEKQKEINGENTENPKDEQNDDKDDNDDNSEKKKKSKKDTVDEEPDGSEI